VVVSVRKRRTLRQRNVELLIGRTPRPFVEEDLVSEQLFDEPFVAVAGINSRWARRRNIGLSDLVGKSWVLPPPDSVPGMLIAEIFRADGLKPPRVIIVTLSVQLTTTLIATGAFMGMLLNLLRIDGHL
jgi:DNA-binding transcriptional LysR family regulator